MSLKNKAGKVLRDAYKLRISKTSGRLKVRLANSKARLNFARKLFTWKDEESMRGLAARTCVNTLPVSITNPSSIPYLNWDEKKLYLTDKDNKEKISTTEIINRWLQIKQYMTHQYSSSGNRVTIYANGSEAYTAMWDAIGEAKYRVWVETYILKMDEVGKRMIAELTKAAKRGVKVVLLYDHFGSFEPSLMHEDLLRIPNALVLRFNDIFEAEDREQLLRRNHQKIIVVDNQYGFCGGMNIAEDYAGPEVKGNSRFRDSHARVVGPCVKHLAKVFMDSVARVRLTSEIADEVMETLYNVNRNLPKIESPHDQSNIFLQVLTSDKGNKKNIQSMMAATIGLAQRHVYLTSPYFLPPRKIRKALIAAANRGVDVRILTCGRSDIPLIGYASYYIYGLFLKNRIRIYELESQELHAKTFTADGTFSMIGSYNLDNLSFKHNMETNLNMIDTGTSLAIEKQFFEDLKNSRRVTINIWQDRPFYLKIWCWIIYQAFHIVLR